MAEIRVGLGRLPAGRRREDLVRTADEVLTGFAASVLPFDADAAVHYALLVVDREAVGRPIAGFDAQIAAVCRSQGATLATRKTKDYELTGIGLIDPWAGAGSVL